MSLFKYKNPETGEWQSASVIRGDPGKTAYEYAQNAGYTGTEAEFSEKLAAEVPTKTSQLINDSGFITGYTETDPTVPAWAKQSAKPTYTASEVGADPVGTAEGKVTVHNTDATSHNDIRIELKALSDRLAAFFDSDDTTLDELSEIVEYIQNNKVLIDSITTSKVSVVDVIDNLVTNVSNKPLSAAQGVVLKGLIDTITVPTKVSQLENDSGYLVEHQDISGKLDASKLPEAVETALENAKESGAFNGKDGVTPHIGDNGNWYVGDTDTGKPSRGADGNDGAPGTDGADGQPGKDGTSPVVAVAAIGGGHRITITDANGTETFDVMDGTDYSFDPTVYGQVCINGENYGYGLPALYLTGDTTGMSKDTKVSLNYVYGDLAGTCTLKWQGNTSAQIAQAIGERGKFNYTIVFDNAFEAHPGWGEQKKYCLKANWNDPSHARNVVSAKLWGLMAQSRADVPQQMAVLPNAGAVDGFPIVIMLNGAFHGLYTFNIPKDEWMFGLGGGTQEAFISADNPADDTHFKGETALDADGMELEWATDENNVGWVKDSLNRMINACVNSWGGDLDTVVGKYLDWASAIDHLILIVLTRGGDNLGKNYLMVTYDGVKWYFAPYDMDLTYGTQFYWQGMMRPVSEVTFDSCAERIRVFELIKRFKTNALKERYWALRKNALSESRIVQYFENFGLKIPLPVMIEDVKLYPSIPGSSVCNIDQIARWVRQRLETMDGWVNALPAQETPVEPEEPSDGYTNLVPLSIDITGSVFNGTGFKENVRLNSSGAESTSGAGGCIVSGFIPYSGGVIRAKGCTVDLSQSGHYVACYDADFNCLKSATSSSIANYAKYGSFEQQEDGKYLLTVSNLALFLSENFSVDIANVKYIRVSMPSCNGADFIVTIGEPIV